MDIYLPIYMLRIIFFIKCYQGLLLTKKLLKQWFPVVKLKSSIHDLVDRYGMDLVDMDFLLKQRILLLLLLLVFYFQYFFIIIFSVSLFYFHIDYFSNKT
jgi:hypothetical protein